MNRLRPVTYLDALDDIVTVDLVDAESFVGNNIYVIKRSGIWPIVIRYKADELARLEKNGEAVCLLALTTGWMVIN